MNALFQQIDNIRSALEKNAKNHAWSACLPLTLELETALKTLPTPQTAQELQILSQVFESFKAMHESANSEHADIAQLLKAFAHTQDKK